LGEHHTPVRQSEVLRLDVVHGELREGDSVLGEGVPVGLHRRVTGRFKQQLGSVGRVGRGDGDPEVFTDRDVVACEKAEHLRVEGERGPLVVHVDAGQGDSHRGSFRSVGHRAAMAPSGALLK
jgi:hypothetical protein